MLDKPTKDDFGRTRRDSVDMIGKKMPKLDLESGYVRYGGMTKEKLMKLPKDVRDRIIKRDKAQRRKLKLDRSKSWTMSRDQVRYEKLYVPYRKVLQL